MKVVAVICSRCRHSVAVPEALGERWCPCGRTYALRGVGHAGWGGPGSPVEVLEGERLPSSLESPDGL